VAPVLLLCCAVALIASNQAALRGAKALETNDFTSAVRYFEEALREEPGNVSILSSLGLSLAGAGRFQEASERFRALIKRQPSVASHHYNLALSLLNLPGRAEEAERCFRQVLRLAPGHLKARAQIANSLLEQARAGNPSKMREAAEAYRSAVAAAPDSAELRFNFAFTLARTGDEEGALREYRQVVRLNPSFPRAQLFLGITLFQLGHTQEAAQHLARALALGEEGFDVRYYLGSALLKNAEHGAAREHLFAAAQKNPEHPGIHFQLAAVHRISGDRARALEEQRLFRELTERQEAKWRAESLESAARTALEKGDLAQGLAALVQVYEARPDGVSARNLALAYLQSGKMAEARHFLEKALNFSPQDSVTHNYLGLLEAREGRLEAAANYFEKAVELNPALIDAVYNAGVTASAVRRHEVGIRYLRAALAQSDTPRVRQALAMVLADAGRHEEAQREFEAAQRQQGILEKVRKKK